MGYEHIAFLAFLVAVVLTIAAERNTRRRSLSERQGDTLAAFVHILAAVFCLYTAWAHQADTLMLAALSATFFAWYAKDVVWRTFGRHPKLPPYHPGSSRTELKKKE